MKKCDRCEESPGTIVCNECATKEDPSPLLYCEACSQLVHIGRNSKHKVISSTSTKEKEETQKKHDKYKRDLRCAELKVEELKNIQDSMDEMLRIHERTIRTTIVTVQEQLKNKAMVNIKTLREQYGKKKEQLEHTASQARQQLDDFQQLSAKIEETLSKDDVAFAEASKDESCIIHQEWKAVGVSLDAPSVEVPFVFNASNLMAQIDLLTLEFHKDAEDLGVAPPSPVTEEGVEMEVEVCCSLGKSGTFWVIPLFGEEVVLKLQRLSNTIRDTYIKDAEWVTYSEDSEGPSVADMVYAKSPKDSKWYRARVEETRISKKASKVTLVDYGCQEVVGFDHLLPWKTDLAPDWPHQAIECSLFDSELIVVGEPQWVFNDRIQAKKLMATFTQQLAQKAVWRVELLATDVMDNIVNVNDAVREKVKGFQDKPKIVCRDIRYVGLEDDGPSAAVSVPSPAAVMKEPEGATESTKAGEVVSVGLGEVDGAGEGTTGTATGADAERDSKSDAITASSCDALSAADKTDSRSDSTPEKTESVKDAGQVASPVGFGDSPLLTWVKASGCLSPSGDGEEEDVGDCGEDTGRCCEAKGDSGHVAASCVEDERRADEPERATQLGDHSYATAADEPSVKISSSAEADTLKRETDNNVVGSAVCVVSEIANLDAQIRHEEAADSVNEVTLIKAASLEEPVVSEGKGQGKDSCERGEVPEAGTDSPTGEVLNLGAPGAGSEPGSQRGPCGPGDGSEPGSQRDPCGPGDGSEPGSQRDSCGPGDGSEPGSQRDSCGPGDGSEPGSQRDSCGPGDGSEPGSQRDSCGPGAGSEPGSQRDSCGPGDGSEPGSQRDSCGPGDGSEPGSQRDSCGPGDGSEPGSQRDSCGPGDGSEPGSQRDSCAPGDGSEPGSQRDPCGPGDGSEPGSQRDSCGPGDGSEPGSQRDSCGPGDGSEPGSQRDSCGPGDGSEPGSQRDSCGPGDGSEPGSQRDSCGPGDGSEPGSQRDPCGLGDGSEPDSQRDSCGPGDGSEPGSQRDSCGPGDGSEPGSQRDSCGPGDGSEPGSQRDSCGPGDGSEPGNQDDICSGEATDTSVSGKKDPDQLEAGTAPSVHLPLEQRQPKQPRRKMFSKTPENTSAGPSVTDREPCSSGNCTANDQPEEATSSDSLSQIDRDTTPPRSSGTLSNEVTTRLSKSLLYQECGMMQKTQTQATSVRDGSGKVHQQQTTVAPSRQSINYAQSGSEVSTQGSATSKGSLSSVSEDARSQSPQLVRSTESASTPSQEASAQSLVSTASGSTTVKSRFSRSVPSTGPPRVVGSQAPQPVPNEASPQGPPESSVSSDPAPNVVQSAPRTTCRDTAAAAGAKVIISRSQPTSTEPSTSGSTSESLGIKPKPPEATTQSPVSAASSERARNAKVDGALSTSAKPDAAHQRLQKRTKASASAGAVPKPRPGAPPGGTTETQGGGNPDIAQALASVPKATGSRFTGQVVSELSPEGCFWMQLDREAWADKAFQTLQTQLQDMVKLFMSVSIVKPKDLVLVPDEKKLWCRAQVKSVVGNKATVCLVDKGRVTVAPVSALREAPDKLWRIPFQSIYCGLQTSTCTHFSQAACAYFDKAIRAKHMGATTVRVTDDVTYVTLHDHESTNVNVKLYELSGISSMPAPMPSASPPLRYIGPGSPLPLCCTYLPVCTPVMQAPLPGVMAPMTCSALDGSGQAYGVDPATGRQCFLMTQGLQSDWTAMDQEVMSLASSTSSLPLLHYDQASGAVVYSTVGGVGPVEMVVTSGGGIVAAENYQPPVPRSPGSPLYQCDPPIGLTWQQQQIQQQQQQQQQQMQMQQQQQQQHQMQMQMQQQQMQMQQQQMQQQQQQQQQQQDQQAVFNEEAWQEDGSMVQEGAAGCTEVGQGRTRPGSGDTRTTSHVRKDSHDRDSQTHRSVGGQLSRRCFNCDEPGHVSRKCPKPQRTDMGSSAGGRSRRGPKTSGAGRSLKGRGRDVKFVPGTTDPSRLTSPEEW